MKSKRTTSVCSSRNSADEVDGNNSSDESDSDESEVESETKKKASQVPITYEYVLGVASPAFHYKLPKAAVEQHAVSANATTTAASSQATSSTRKQSAKSNATKASGQAQANSNKKHHHVQQSHKIVESEASPSEALGDEKQVEVSSAKQSLFLKLLKAIREFFYNRNNWSVTEESVIICSMFMLFAIVVGSILNFAVEKVRE
jgi:type IV secretory pathway VirB10-like protein